MPPFLMSMGKQTNSAIAFKKSFWLKLRISVLGHRSQLALATAYNMKTDCRMVDSLLNVD